MTDASWQKARSLPAVFSYLVATRRHGFSWANRRSTWFLSLSRWASSSRGRSRLERDGITAFDPAASIVRTNGPLSFPSSAITCPAGMTRISASARDTSWAWPPERIRRAGLPRASAAMWSFVVRPPRERPTACSPLLSRAGGVLMGPDDRGIDQQVLQVGVASEGLQDAAPDARLSPAVEPLIGGVGRPEPGGQVGPGRAGAGYPEDGVEEQAVVLGRRSGVVGLARQQLLDAAEAVIVQLEAAYRRASVRSVTFFGLSQIARISKMNVSTL